MEIITKLRKLLENINSGDEIVTSNNEMVKNYDASGIFDAFLNGERITIKTSIGELTSVDQTGTWNDGSDFSTIFKFEDKFYEIPATYSSWSESEFHFDDLREVKEVEVTMKQWVKV